MEETGIVVRLQTNLIRLAIRGLEADPVLA